MTDARIGVARQGAPVYHVGRDDGGLFIAVASPSAQQFVVGRAEDELAIDVLPRAALEPVYSLAAAVDWTGNLGYPDPGVSEVELEALLAYPGANFGIWAGGSYTALTPMWGYPQVIELNDHWHSLGTYLVQRDGDEELTTAGWVLPGDAEPTLSGIYLSLAVRAPALVDSGVPSLKTRGGSAYHPVFAVPGLSLYRTIDMTRNYVLSPAANTPLLAQPSNWPTWPPEW